MFMEAFATGFSLSSGTKPGFSQENDKYSLTFSEVICDQAKNIVSRGFEHCYNWKAVMDLILEATEEVETDNIIDIEAGAEESLKEWLVTFQGWGLLSSILDSKMHRHVLLSLAYTSSNWDESTGGEFTEEKVFETVKYVYDNMPGKELRTLLPKFGCWFEEIVDGSKLCERKKMLTLFFNAKWALEVKFVLEKKRVNKNLVDFAAEAAVQKFHIEEDIEDLDIPETLYNVIREKFRDIEWVRSYWNSQPFKQFSPNLSNIETEQEKEKKLTVEHQEEEEEEEEFLSSVMEELSEDVHQMIEANIGANPEGRRKDPPAGIDSLLTLWVVIFMIIAFIVYAWC